MGFEKHSSKGGYVGGFLQLFDWNAKSRKKLLSSKSGLPERTKQGKKSHTNLPSTRLQLVDEDEIGAGSSIKGSSEYSCTSSVTDEEGYGARAPGVVARLMGLDSLLPSKLIEPYCSPLSDSVILRDAHHEKKDFNFHRNHEMVRSGTPFGKAEVPATTLMEPKPPSKLFNKSIEKFRTETLPPKSAKSIPVTHHRLLSPIKNPNFHTTKNAAQIMEAAAKIIEQRPETCTKARVPPQSPQVPIKVRKFKERVEVSQKPVKALESSRARSPLESNAAKCLKGQSMNKSWSGSDDASLRTSTDAEENSSAFRKKGKSVSLAIQAKVNVQKRESLVSTGSVSPGQKENTLQISPQIDKQSMRRKKVDVCSSSVALRQNNQKQNCNIDGYTLHSKPLPSNSQRRKVMPSESSVIPNRNLNKSRGNLKTGYRRMEFKDGDRGLPHSKKKILPQKKRSVSNDFQPGRSCVVNNVLIDNKQKKLDCRSDEPDCWAENGVNKGMEVVSFTFTAPMMRHTNASEESCQGAEQNKSSLQESTGKPGIKELTAEDLHRGDALSVLLEQKLLELSNEIISSKRRLQDECDDEQGLLGGANDSEGYCHSGESPFFEASVETCSERLTDLRHPSPISILEPFSIESCNSSDSIESNSTEGSLQCSSVRGQRVDRSNCLKLHSVDVDIELSDSASSTSTGNSTRKEKAREWELGYVKEVLSDIELKCDDFSFNGGDTSEILEARIFFELEERIGNIDGEAKESMLERKELFDCIGECVGLRFQQYAGGSCRVWSEGVAIVRRKQRLAADVYREISKWRGMVDCMVDELVDRDMSSSHHCGRWLEFGVEVFEVGVEVVDQVVDGLIDEVVADMSSSQNGVLII